MRLMLQQDNRNCHIDRKWTNRTVMTTNASDKRYTIFKNGYTVH